MALSRRAFSARHRAHPDRPLQQASRTLAIRLPNSSLERDFRHRRQAPRKRPEDNISEQRPELGDYRALEMAAKTAFLLASCQLRVSQDWVVAEAVVRNWSPKEYQGEIQG
jgi:hypothetical protein